MRRIAIFDLDYTLTEKGTWGRFVMRCMAGRSWRWPELALRAGVMQGLYTLGVVPRIAVKTQMMRVCMTGRTQEELDAIAESFAEDEVESGLRPGGVEALQAHQSSGEEVMIASAAVDLLVGKIASRLGVMDWVATDMAWREGRLTDHFASPNCYGAQKLEAVEAYFRKSGAPLKPDETFITMYSDSASDVDLFDVSDDAVAVHPSAKLRRMAESRGWRIVDWSETTR